MAAYDARTSEFVYEALSLTILRWRRGTCLDAYRRRDRRLMHYRKARVQGPRRACNESCRIRD